MVGITPADYPGHPLAGIAFQRHWEERAYVAGGRNYCAPVQRVEFSDDGEKWRVNNERWETRLSGHEP